MKSEETSAKGASGNLEIPNGYLDLGVVTALQISQLATKLYFEKENEDNNKVIFNHFTCQYSDCCQFAIESYTAELISGSYLPIQCCQLAVDTDTGLQKPIYTVETASVGQFKFKIKAISALGDVGYSDPIEIIIGEK